MELLVVKEETRSAVLITATLHGKKRPSDAHHRSLVCPSSGLPLGHVASGHPFKIRARSCFPEQKLCIGHFDKEEIQSKAGMGACIS